MRHSEGWQVRIVREVVEGDERVGGRESGGWWISASVSMVIVFVENDEVVVEKAR